MGNLCSSGSERVDNKEEKRVPDKLKGGEDEALLPKSGAGVGSMAGEGFVDGSGCTGGLGSADVTSKILENGQCVMSGGRSVCPEIVVSSSDVELVDEDDDDFLNSVIAVAADTAGRAVATARDVVAEVEASGLSLSGDAVAGSPEATQHGDGSARDSVDVDYSALVKSSRESVGAESGNWADSVLMYATTAAQSALDGVNFATTDLSSDFTGKEGDVPMSTLEENSNNIVALSPTVSDTVDEEAVPGNDAERSAVLGEVGQRGTDSVSGIPIQVEHRVENALSTSDGLSKDAVSSGPQVNGTEGFGLVAEGEGRERWVVGEASDHQNDSLGLVSAGGRTKPVSPCDQTGTHEGGLGTSVDAEVNFRDRGKQEVDHINRDEDNTHGKEFTHTDVPSTLGAVVGQPTSELFMRLAESCVDTGSRSGGNTCIEDDMAVDNNGTGHFKENNVLPWTFNSQNEIAGVDATASLQQPDGDVQLTADTGAATCGTQHEHSDAVVAGASNVVALVSEQAEHVNQEVKTGEDSSGTPMMLSHAPEAEMKVLDRSRLPGEDDIFTGWSIVSDTDFLKDVKSDEDISHEEAAMEIVESIIARASLIVNDTDTGQDSKNDFLPVVDREAEILAEQQRIAMLASLTERFASSPCPDTELSPSPPVETDQRQSALVESTTSSISQGDLIEIDELLIPPVSPFNVSGESTGSHIFGSSDEGSDVDDVSIKQIAWGITDKAVQEAVKIVADNECHIEEDFNQTQNNDLDLYPSEDASVQDECNSVLSEASLNNNKESPTHINGVNSFPTYSTMTSLTSDHPASVQLETSPTEDTVAQSISHTNIPLENDHPAHASSTPSGTDCVSASSPPTPNGHHADSHNRETSPLCSSKVPSCLPPLDTHSLPDKPVIIIINSPDSAANTGSNEDISGHTEAVI